MAHRRTTTSGLGAPQADQAVRSGRSETASGDTAGWALGTADTQVQLRAEPSPTGNRRAHEFVNRAVDKAGNVSVLTSSTKEERRAWGGAKTQTKLETKAGRPTTAYQTNQERKTEHE
jgi:hypothetical protein